jgi:hypothetical protein
MSHPNRSPGSPVLMALLAEHSHFRSSPGGGLAVLRPSAARGATDPRVAANDDAPEKRYQIHNPLWVIVIGNAFLFAVMALVVALG